MQAKLRNAILTALFLTAVFFSGTPLSQATQDEESARCSKAIVQVVGKHFGLDSFDFPRENYYPSLENGGLIVAGACKQSPSKKQEVISAFAYDAGNEGEKTLLIAAIDRRSHKIVASYQYKYVEDPGGIGKVGVDTARYKLSRNVRAFGVDITPGYSHNCGDGGGGAERTLYVQEGSTLRPILYIPSMSYWRFIKGSKCVAYSDGEIEIVEDIKLAVEIADSETKGYRDIVLSATSSRTDGKPIGNGRFHYTIRYNGQQYPVQEMEQSFYKWQQIGDHEP